MPRKPGQKNKKKHHRMEGKGDYKAEDGKTYKTETAYKFRKHGETIGNALGGAYGQSHLGSAIGRALGAGLSKMFRYGDYTTGVRTNSLMKFGH